MDKIVIEFVEMDTIKISCEGYTQFYALNNSVGEAVDMFLKDYEEAE